MANGTDEKTDEKEFASERELIITEVSLKKDKENNLKKAVLLTNKGQKITYSGKEFTIEVSDMDGMKIEQDVAKPISMKEAKKKLSKYFEIQKVIDNKQECKIKLSYHIWNKEVDGEVEKYRYIQNAQYKEMEILDKAIEEEVVE
jgi:hypothetical protein